jgi:hypothetical protein
VLDYQKFALGRRGSAWTVVTALVLGASGCATQAVRSGGELGAQLGGGDALMASMGAQLSVEKFLQAANSSDYYSMAMLFGTTDGPVEGARTDIEREMDLISRILRHNDYRIGTQRRVPGREAVTTRVGVDITIGNEVVSDVEFVVVQTGEYGWLIEEIDLEAITNR